MIRMGLFDNLVKQFNESGLKDELSKVGKEIGETVNNAGNDLQNLVSTGSTGREAKKVPGGYEHFPQFDGVIKDISTKVIDKYHRCTIDYEKSTVEKINEYRNQVVAAGYAKATDVRYEKGKEYIIIDPDGDCLHLVFHIKH